jgi:translocation and assembly module TamB
VRGVPLADSHLDVRMTNLIPREVRAVGHTRCGAPIAAPFDKQAYLADASPRGEWNVSGNLFGAALTLTDVNVTRARSPHVTGRASLRGVDVEPFVRILTKPETTDAGTAPPTWAVGGQVWGELMLDDVWLDAPARSKARLLLGPTFLVRGGQRITLRPPRDPIVVANDTLRVPPLRATLETPEGFRGGLELSGEATQLTTEANLAFAARIDPVDLAILERFVPKVDKAIGHIEGSLRLSGRFSSPAVAGELHLVGDDIEIRGLPSAVTDTVLDVDATATELTAAGTGKFAGGTIALHATSPVRGLEVGPVESRVTIRGVRLAPEEGVSGAFDADLQVAYDPRAQLGTTAALPHVGGEVTLDAVRYTRPITFNLDIASARAKRTQVETYDPALDLVALDVLVRSRSPIVIKNNLAEVQLGIDSGKLEVAGTNQRIGLRGALRTLPNGRFHFQSSDFEVQQGFIRFDDPTKIDPNVDITAVTEYRRYTDSSAGAAAGAGATAASAGSTRGGSLWRITMHAYGDADNVRIQLTSEPALSQQDIVLLLTVGMTRAELDQLQASGIGQSVALNALGAATGADRAVKEVLPIIDDFRFGSAYSTVTGKTEPQLTVGKRLTNDLRATVTAGLSADRELRSNIEWRLNNQISLQGAYDNINDVSNSTLGNIGLDLRWRLEFE